MPAQDGGNDEELLAQPAVLHVAEPPVLDHVPVEGEPLKMEGTKGQMCVARRWAWGGSERWGGPGILNKSGKSGTVKRKCVPQCARAHARMCAWCAIVLSNNWFYLDNDEICSDR